MAFDRRRIGHRGYALVSRALEEAGFLAAFSERTGGVSEGPYRSLNLSLSVGDDPARVGENRSRLAGGLAVRPFALGEQAHGARLVRVGSGRAGAGFHGGPPLAGADGLVTASVGVALGVLVADCLPVVLASPAEGLVAVIHVGWRGLAAGIVQRAASLFERPRDVRVAIGPAIGPCHYEVGEDVALAVAAGSEAGAVTERRGGRRYLDLLETARLVLRARGLRRVEGTGLCTACHPNRFFSHRRDGVTGRQAGVAVRLA